MLSSSNLEKNISYSINKKIEPKKNKGMFSIIFRIKSDIDKNTILDLREEIDILKVNYQKACLHIEELIRENTQKKRMNDARLNEVQQINIDIKNIDNKNQRTNEENKSLLITVNLYFIFRSKV